jgi:uncharacterized protein YdhG (YjbR/CyaY superfamily)
MTGNQCALRGRAVAVGLPGGNMQSKKNALNTFNTIDEYIGSFPPEIQKMLQALRAAVKAAAPEAQERISYRMPAFWLQGNLAYFAAFKNHIGFFPTSSGIRAFAKELSGYQSSKGGVQFPLDRPLPLKLVAKMVKYRVWENSKPAKAKLK